NRLRDSISGLCLAGQLLRRRESQEKDCWSWRRKPYASFQGSVAQALRAFPQYTTIWDMFQPTGYDLYNSLQIRLQKRYSNGLSFLLAYTLSKNIGFGGSDTFGDLFGGGGNKGIDTFNRKLERAIENIDQTHVFVFSWTYELPFGRGK